MNEKKWKILAEAYKIIFRSSLDVQEFLIKTGMEYEDVLCVLKAAHIIQDHENIIKKPLEKKFYFLKYKNNKKIKTSSKQIKTPNYTKKENCKETFRSSHKWRTLRYKMLEKYEGKCQLCGRTSKDGVIIHADHIIPLSVDWDLRLDENNIQILCDECNIGKSNQSSKDWR